MCLLDIAKAFPSTTHPCILEALRLIGTPQDLLQLVNAIYTSSSKQYCDFRYPLRRGIKEGCPLCPPLFILVGVYRALCARCAKSWLFSTTGSSVSSED